MRVAIANQPPELLKILAHEVRWKILNALSLGDLRVGELIQVLNQPANLVSYHLKLLRENGVVASRRSSADGRDIYYKLNLECLQALYFSAGEQLHPALHVEVSCLKPVELSVEWPARILFVCTHNSARSQMAEALMRRAAGEAAEVYSAGRQPSAVHPLAVKVMAARGIDMDRQRSKHLDEFAGHSFNYVITVCDRAREVCPVFPDQPVNVHWSLPDPAEMGATEEERRLAFEQTADQLATRIHYLLSFIGKQEGSSPLFQHVSHG
jgi:protein-tyrosine-phosphatase/DNA-binding transcriptional ArsR family regulator